MRGLDENSPLRKQPEGTSPDLLNVRAYDAIDERARGGQRSGLSKYFADAVNGSNWIQFIGQVVRGLDPSSVVADTLIDEDDFTYSNGDLATVGSTKWPACYKDEFNTATTDGFLVASNQLNRVTLSGTDYQAIFRSVTLGTAFIVQFDLDAESSDYVTKFGVCVRVNGTTPRASGCYVITIESAGAGAPTQYYARCRRLINGSYTQIGVATDPVLPGGASWGGGPFSFEVRMNGNVCEVYCDGNFVVQWTLTLWTANDRVALFYPGTTGHYRFEVDNFKIYTGISPAVLRTTTLVVVSGGNLYAGTPDAGLSLAASGTGAFASAVNVDGVGAYGKMYLCDGNYANYRVYDPLTDTVSLWSPTAGQLPGGGVGTAYPITAVDQANKTFTATGASALGVGTFIEVYGSTGNDGAYKITVDGTDTKTVGETIPDSTADGNLREATAACRYITLYRGRIVLWGLHTDPQNWFMSAVGAPLDFDYSPSTTTETMAIAGNNSDAGKLGDVLNCCAPYSDDVMVMGGDHTLSIMSGDPASGGVIDNISYEMGIAGPGAYSYDADGNLYYYAAGTFWRMAANPGVGFSRPEPLSRGRIDKALGDIDLSAYHVRLLWDNETLGLHIILVPTTEPSAGSAPVHYYWSSRTDAFWKDQYQPGQGPTAIHTYNADDPNDRAVLLGGWDSYVRYLDSTAKDDDATSINSYVAFTPIVVGDMLNIKVTNIRPIMADNSEAVRLEVHAAKTAEQVAASTTPVFTKNLSAGRNAPMLQRATGNAIMLRLENDDTDNQYQWAMESITAAISAAGRQRHGRI